MDWKDKRITQLEEAVKRLSGPKTTIESKKFLAAFLGFSIGLYIDPELSVWVCIAYIIGQGLADLGKNKR